MIVIVEAKMKGPSMFAEVPPYPLDAQTITVLGKGNERQQAAYRCVTSRDFLHTLLDFRCVLASTIALGVDTPTSDLDFLCETSDLDHFSGLVLKTYGGFDRFHQIPTPTPNVSRCYSFCCDGFEIEIFGSLEPIENQLGYRHHVVMARLVNIGGDEFRLRLRELKLTGIKTEPAIAELLCLTGNPYQSVLSLLDYSDRAIEILFSKQKQHESVQWYGRTAL